MSAVEPGGLLLFACIASLLPIARSSLLWVHTDSISCAIDDATGELVSVNASSAAGGFFSSVRSLSWLGEAPAVVESAVVTRCGAGGASVCVSRSLNVTGQRSDASCCAFYTVTAADTYGPVSSPAAGVPSSVSWTFSITEALSGVPWRSRIVTDVAFDFANASAARFWAPHAGPDAAGGEWTDVLAMLAAPSALSLQYGDGFIFESDIAAGREVMPVPLSVAALDGAGGIALAHAPSDLLLAAYADVNSTYASFSRLYNRLGEGGSVAFTTHLVPLAGADWRPAFAWARATWPAYFLPTSLLLQQPAAEGSQLAGSASGRAQSDTHSIAPPPPPPPHLSVGLGMYTCADVVDVNSTFLHAVAATHIWDAHFFWPYQG